MLNKKYLIFAVVLVVLALFDTQIAEASKDLIKPDFVESAEKGEKKLKELTNLVFKWTVFITIALLVIGLIVGGCQLGGVFGKREQGADTIKYSIMGAGVVVLAGAIIGGFTAVMG